MSTTIELDQASFEATISSDRPTLVDFWAPWCGPCRALGPTIDQLATNLEGQANITKVNIDDHPEIAAKFGISSIPTVIVFKNGEVDSKFVGIQSYDEYASALES